MKSEKCDALPENVNVVKNEPLDEIKSVTIHEEDTMEIERRGELPENVDVIKKEALDETDVVSETHDKPSEAFELSFVVLNETHQCLSDVMDVVEKIKSERRDELPEEALDEMNLLTLNKTDQNLPDIIDEEENMESERYDESSEDVDIMTIEAFEEIKSRTFTETDQFLPDILDEDEKMKCERRDELPEEALVEMELLALNKTDQTLRDVIDIEESERHDELSEDVDITTIEAFEEIKSETDQFLPDILDEDEKMKSEILGELFEDDEMIEPRKMTKSESFKEELSSESNMAMSETKESEIIDEHEIRFPSELVITNVTSLAISLTDKDEEQVSLDNFEPAVDDNEIQIDFEAFPLITTVKMEPVSDDEMDVEFPLEDVVVEEVETPAIKIEFDEPEKIIGNITWEAVIMGEKLNKNNFEKPHRRILRSTFGAPVKNYKMDDSEDDEDEMMVYKKECLQRRAIILLQRSNIIPSMFTPLKNFIDAEDHFIQVCQALRNAETCRLQIAKEAHKKQEAKRLYSKLHYKRRKAKEMLKHENEDPEERRKRKSEINKMRRANETPEQRTKRLLAAKDRRASKTPAQRKQLRLQRAELYKKQRANETPEHRTKRLATVAERLRRATDTPEKREQIILKRKYFQEMYKKRLAILAERKKKARETPKKKRAPRSFYSAELYKMRKANETPEERTKRLVVRAKNYRRRREKEKLERLLERLAAMAEKKRKAEEMLKKREQNLLYEAETYKKTMLEQHTKRLAALAERDKRARNRENNATEEHEKPMKPATKRNKSVQQVERNLHKCEVDGQAKHLTEIQEETLEEGKHCLASVSKRMKQLLEEEKVTPDERNIMSMEIKSANEIMKEEQCLATEMTRIDVANGTPKCGDNSLVTTTETNKDVSEIAQQCLVAAGEIIEHMIMKGKGGSKQCENSAVAKTNKEVSETLSHQQHLSSAVERIKLRAKRKTHKQARE